MMSLPFESVVILNEIKFSFIRSFFFKSTLSTLIFPKKKNKFRFKKYVVR